MEKEIKDDLDETGVENAEIPSEKEAPKDVRGAIKAAFREQEEKDADTSEGASEEPVRQRKSKERSLRQDKEDKDSDNKDSREDLQGKDDNGRRSSDRKDDKKESKTEGTPDSQDVGIEPPPYYRNKGKAAWEKLDKTGKELLLAREKEVSDGFAQVSQRLRSAEDLEKAVAPRLQAIQQFGVTPGQTVDRLFQWMEALSGPNKLNSFKELARSFGVDISQLVQDNTTQPEAKTNDPPTWFNQFTQNVSQEIGTLKQTLSAQQRAAAESYVLNWAQDKPHYQQVAPLMGRLLEGGLVPTKNGNIDLDAAYEQACKLDPAVSALIQQEAAEKASKEASQKAAKEAKEKAERLAKARRAGAGLKPAPAASPVSSPSRANGVKRPDSVRDSIKQAFEELRE